MNIAIQQLQYSRSILDAEDIKIIAKIASCTPSLVRNVLACNRNNNTVEYLCYKRAKEKSEKMLQIAEEIEQKNRELFRSLRMPENNLFSSEK